MAYRLLIYLYSRIIENAIPIVASCAQVDEGIIKRHVACTDGNTFYSSLSLDRAAFNRKTPMQADSIQNSE